MEYPLGVDGPALVELTGCAELTEDESHGQAPFP